MTRLYVLVEGQTEEEFAKGVLAPHLQGRGVWVYPIIVETSRAKFGRKRKGGGKWKHWLRNLKALTGEQKGTDIRLTTMFDLYGLPDDFPELGRYASEVDTRLRADGLTTAMANVVDDHRLIPYLQRHEFEALVLASLPALTALVEDDAELRGIATLQVLVQNSSPEDINDGEATAPSKRLAELVPSYRKTFHGPLATRNTGLAGLRKACPRFDAWITKLEGLGGSESTEFTRRTP